MIYIDDAGTGCCIGTPIVAVYREETGENAIGLIEQGTSVSQLSYDLLMNLKPSKTEKILVCSWKKFNSLAQQLSSEGYSVERGQVEGEAQDFAENSFTEQLYELGLSRTVKLCGKEYQQFHNDIVDDMFRNPKLLKHLRKEYNTNSTMNTVMRKIWRLTGEFPHLHRMMVFNENPYSEAEIQ